MIAQDFSWDLRWRGEDGARADRPVRAPDHRALLTHDAGMRRLLATVESVAASSVTVLIQGESGTGKELLARLIHQRSPRAPRPFIAVNCAALPDGLVESELFGHERGAFTGALFRKLGKCERAHTGTLLLDEISEKSLSHQAKLLRVLQEREVDRVGGTEPVPIDIRVIATTNRVLARDVEQGRFREDLYYRLHAFPVVLPPLRARPSDIPLLARHFVVQAAERNGRAPARLSDEATASLQQWPWRGNVRELEHAMERAVLLAGDGPILPEHCPAELNASRLVQPTHAPPPSPPSGGLLRDMERREILQTLAEKNGNRTHAARALGISIRTIRNKLREYRELERQP